MEMYRSFRQLSVYPTQSEMLGARNPVSKNIIQGKYRNVEQYLDIHFNLLREDFVAPLRQAIANYREDKPVENVYIYEKVNIFSEPDRFGKERTKIKLNVKEDLEETEKFKNGTLLIFTRNNFASTFLAKVSHRAVSDLRQGQVTIEFVNERDETKGRNYTMAESSAFFEPYYQVLKALKTIPVHNFPMSEYIIDARASTSLPEYLTPTSKYEIDGYSFYPKFWPLLRKNLLNLNDAQLRAFKAALTQKFVVIQGPPGTGKTFLGLKIAETLIKNCDVWYNSSPILVISHKNHALDQFLEGLTPITKRLVRVGGQSKSEKLEKFNLRHQKDVDVSELLSGLALSSQARACPRDDLAVLRGALVVGMTTSAAARLRATLEELACPIVIVEEAAEVLEAHVVASLTSHCQHLILLGDHQQLRPKTADHHIGTHYHLGVSLFERMVLNGIHCYQLSVQHRMRPEISTLLKLKIYPFLTDHRSVENKPPIRGMQTNVFFLDHHHPEESCNGTTKKNTHEAKFLTVLAAHLIQNGYASDQIAILTTYSGQVCELENEANAHQEWLKDVRISTLDAFQGEESEIVLLSLVRSEEIGFLSVENRICVALSRAKNGFYIMGNMDLLAKQSELWSMVKRCLEGQNAIGQELVLRCQNHPKIVTKVKCADDFLNVRDGGCGKKCPVKLPCGHQCALLCHVLNAEHEDIKCMEVCGRRFCKEHKIILKRSCKRMCFQDCDECPACSVRCSDESSDDS